jgi:hypothetical protein
MLLMNIHRLDRINTRRATSRETGYANAFIERATWSLFLLLSRWDALERGFTGEEALSRGEQLKSEEGESPLFIISSKGLAFWYRMFHDIEPIVSRDDWKIIFTLLAHTIIHPLLARSTFPISEAWRGNSRTQSRAVSGRRTFIHSPYTRKSESAKG